MKQKINYRVWVLIDSNGMMTVTNQINHFGKALPKIASVYISETDANEAIKLFSEVNERLKLPKIKAKAIPVDLTYYTFTK